MIKKKLKLSDYFVIAANLLPVIGVWFLGWDAASVFLAYCLETIIIGFYNLVKMGVVTAVRGKDDWHNQGKTTKQSGLFFMLFFLVHYGFFVAIQMILFMSVSGIGKSSGISPFNFFLKWPSLLDRDTIAILIGFILSYGIKFFTDFIYPKQYKTIPMMILMFQPYGRIFVQQVVVILGSMFLAFGAGKIFVMIFALVKIFFEVYINYDGLLNKAAADMKKEAEEQPSDKNNLL